MLDPQVVLTNFAVNNDGDYYPRVNVSHTGQHSSPAKLIDGNVWYHVHPPNRWTAAGSKNERDWVELDLGTPRKIHTIKLYFLDDATDVVPPKACEIEYWRGRIAGNLCRISNARLLRVVFTHQGKARSGLTEVEIWKE